MSQFNKRKIFYQINNLIMKFKKKLFYFQVSKQALEVEKLHVGNQEQQGTKSKSKHRMQDKEMRLLARINEKLNNLKEKAKPDFEITDDEHEDVSNEK